MILEQIKRIKYLRLNPFERYLIDLVDLITIKHETDVIIYYSISGEIAFEYDKQNDLFRLNKDYWNYLCDTFYTTIQPYNKNKNLLLLRQTIYSIININPKYSCIGLSKID